MKLLSFEICTIFVILLFSAGTAYTAIPLVINHQGVVTVDGVPHDGEGLFKFGFLDAEGKWLWTNDNSHVGESAAFTTPDSGVTLTVRSGVYAVPLGDTSLDNMEALPSTMFDSDTVRLRILFDDGGVNGEQLLSPDQSVTAGAYAFHALNADAADTATTAGDADTVDGAHALALEESSEIDADITAHTVVSDAHHTKTTDASELTLGTLPDARLSANVTQLGPSIALETEVSGTLPDGSVASTIARDSEITTEISSHASDASAHHTKTTSASELTSGTLPGARLSANVTQLGSTIELTSTEVTGVLPDTKIAAAIARDTEIDEDVATHDGNPAAHAALALDASQIATGTLDNARLDTSAFVLPAGAMVLGATADDSALIAAGYTFGGMVLAADTGSDANVWSTQAPMLTARNGLAAAAVNGVIYAIGGYKDDYMASNEAYDPDTGWSGKPSMYTPRQGLAAAAVNGVIYAIGGQNSSGFLATVEAYDTATNTWNSSPLADMPTPRTNLAAAVANGVIYAIGGNNGSYLKTVEAYDPATDTWDPNPLANMPTGRNDLAAAAVNGVIYAIGGNNGPALATIEAYDPATDTWNPSPLANMPTARTALAAAVVNGVIYAIGGSGGSGYLTTIEAYGPAIDTWNPSPLANMPTGRAILTAAAVNGVIYAVGGYNDSGYLATNEAYTPSTSLYVYTKD